MDSFNKDVIRIEGKPLKGKCKWFSIVKGFGFLEVDDGGADLFVHQSDIITDNYPVLTEGQRLSFIFAIDRLNGRSKAKEVKNEDGTPIRTHKSLLDPTSLRRLQENPEIETGSLKWFDSRKCYGFIVPTDRSKPEIFVHLSQIKGGIIGMKLPEGLEVEYKTTEQETKGGQKGMQASEVTGPGGVPLFSLNYSSMCYSENTPLRPGVKRGRVKWYNPTKGYGFVIPESLDDIRPAGYKPPTTNTGPPSSSPDVPKRDPRISSPKPVTPAEPADVAEELSAQLRDHLTVSPPAAGDDKQSSGSSASSESKSDAGSPMVAETQVTVASTKDSKQQTQEDAMDEAERRARAEGSRGKKEINMDEIFVHRTAIKGTPYLFPDQLVEYEVEFRNGCARATVVTAPGGMPLGVTPNRDMALAMRYGYPVFPPSPASPSPMSPNSCMSPMSPMSPGMPMVGSFSMGSSMGSPTPVMNFDTTLDSPPAVPFLPPRHPQAFHSHAARESFSPRSMMPEHFASPLAHPMSSPVSNPMSPMCAPMSPAHAHAHSAAAAAAAAHGHPETIPMSPMGFHLPPFEGQTLFQFPPYSPIAAAYAAEYA